MPSRSNAFQRLVWLIETALSGSEANVQESVLVRDVLDGSLREIDVVIEIPVDPRILRVAVECRDHQRPATVEWINQLTGKYLHLPVDRVVAVSRSGFTDSARKKAEAVRIDLLTLDDAQEFDWAAVPDVKPAVVMSSIRYAFRKVTVTPSFFLIETRDDALRAMDLPIYRQGGPEIPLRDKLHWDVCREETMTFLKQTWTREPRLKIVMRLDFTSRGWFARDAIGNERELVSVDTIIDGGIDFIHLTMRPAAYAGTTVAYGESSIDGEPVSVAVVLRDDKPPQWHWYLKSGREFPWRSVTPESPNEQPPSLQHLGHFYMFQI